MTRCRRVGAYTAATLALTVGIALVAASTRHHTPPPPAPAVHHVQPLRVWIPAGPHSLTIGV